MALLGTRSSAEATSRATRSSCPSGACLPDTHAFRPVAAPAAGTGSAREHRYLRIGDLHSPSWRCMLSAVGMVPARSVPGLHPLYRFRVVGMLYSGAWKRKSGEGEPSPPDVETLGARNRSRTCTSIRTLHPEYSASANSAIRAQKEGKYTRTDTPVQFRSVKKHSSR